MIRPGAAVLTRTGALLAFLALFLFNLPAAYALETDQYYAWGREISDATEVLNSKVAAEIAIALEQVNRRPAERVDCDDVAKAIVSRFKLFIFHDIEVWATNTSLVERVPGTDEEALEFRQRYLYHNTGPFDIGVSVPPSPTIKLNGVAVGTDKLSHFFAEGWWYHRWYRSALAKGLSEAEAEDKAIRRGVFSERTILGMRASGVFSLADLEANYQGMLFIDGLCHGGDPRLERTEGGWVLAGEFDFARYVTPEWDESYQVSVFSKRRWRKVLPVLAGYCAMLDHPAVVSARREYASWDRLTPTERHLQALVRRGKLPDPRKFSLAQTCADAGTDEASLAFEQEWDPTGADPATGITDRQSAEAGLDRPATGP